MAGQDAEALVRAAQILRLGRDPFHGVVANYRKRRTARRALRNLESPEEAVVAADGVPVEARWVRAGDMAMATNPDEDGMPQCAVILPANMVMFSTIKDGVRIEHDFRVLENVKYWRFIDGS